MLHNAGLLGDIAPMADLSMTMWQEVMQVNVNATFMLTQALLPLLLKSHAGSLVFTSSSVGRTGRADWVCLCGVEVRHRGNDAGVGRRV